MVESDACGKKANFPVRSTGARCRNLLKTLICSTLDKIPPDTTLCSGQCVFTCSCCFCVCATCSVLLLYVDANMCALLFVMTRVCRDLDWRRERNYLLRYVHLKRGAYLPRTRERPFSKSLTTYIMDMHAYSTRNEILLLGAVVKFRHDVLLLSDSAESKLP